jgi:hypothetical protein
MRFEIATIAVSTGVRNDISRSLVAGSLYHDIDIARDLTRMYK